MKSGRWAITLAGIFSAGAVTMYFLDPQRGKRRRIEFKDALIHSGHQLEKFAGRFREDFENRIEGAMAETEHFLHSTPQAETRHQHQTAFLEKSWSPTAQVIAGSAGLSLIGYGLTRRESAGTLAGLGGVALLARSIFNMPLRRVVGVVPGTGIRIQKTLHIAASPDEIYAFWNNPENFPKVFSHIKEVTREEDDTYGWQLMGPAGIPLHWTAMITRRVPGKIIEWHSAPGSAIENHGTVRIDGEKDGRTRVHIQMTYNPPVGMLGHAFAALLGMDPRSLMDEDFVRLKALLEQGRTRVHGHEVRKSDLEEAKLSAS